MARVHRTATPVPAGYPPVLPVTPTSLDVPFTAADATNKEDVTWAEGLTILARNTGVGARTVTITSTPINGRVGDISAYSIAAGGFAIFANIPSNGFRQSSDGKVYFEASHAEVLFACIILP